VFSLPGETISKRLSEAHFAFGAPAPPQPRPLVVRPLQRVCGARVMPY
jgi:hypothetical protein